MHSAPRIDVIDNLGYVFRNINSPEGMMPDYDYKQQEQRESNPTPELRLVLYSRIPFIHGWSFHEQMWLTICGTNQIFDFIVYDIN